MEIVRLWVGVSTRITVNPILIIDCIVTRVNYMPDKQDEIWITEDGKQIQVCDLSEDEAKDALRLMLQEQREEDTAVINSITAALSNIDKAIASTMSRPASTALTMHDIDKMFRDAEK